MDTSKDDSDNDILWRLTADQRQQVYKEEREKIKQTAPTFSKKTKIYIVLYALGCAVIYSGIIKSLTNLFDTGRWQHKTDIYFFTSSLDCLANVAVLLLRPLLTGFVTVFIFFMPTFLACLFIFNIDLMGKLRKYLKLDDE